MSKLIYNKFTVGTLLIINGFLLFSEVLTETKKDDIKEEKKKKEEDESTDDEPSEPIGKNNIF